MKRFVAVVFVLSVCACDKQPRPPVAESSSARASSGILKTVVVPVERKKLHAALKLGSPTNDVRLVQVFRGGAPSDETGGPPPEYRFFDIKDDSAYALLGFRNGDILLTVEDHYLYRPENFPQYVRALLNVQGGAVEVRRAGDPMLLRFQISGPPVTQE